MQILVKAQKEYHAKKETSKKESSITLTSTRATFKNIISTRPSHWYTTEVTTRATIIETATEKKTTTEYVPRTTFNLYTTPAWPNIIITKKKTFFSTTTSTTTTTLPPSMNQQHDFLRADATTARQWMISSRLSPL